MLREERHGDVVRLAFESWQSRSMGFGVSAWLVRGALVDTGFDHVGPEFASWLQEHHVDGVLVTHYHEDHAGNIELAARRGVPVWASDLTLQHLRHPEPIGWYRRWCWGAQRALHSRVEPFSHPALEAIHTPGHSADHHVVWDAERETIFGADLFLGVRVRISHPWPREDIRAQVASLRRVVALRPARFFDAHRGLVPNATALLSAKADWIEETLGRVDDLIASGWDDRAIARHVLGAETSMSYVTGFDYSRRNFVGSARATRRTST